ncbi:hypothetical protein Hypma_003315 [Hypsizygus marmoreus]|uniref:Uncharacterized protein n=1 Tax=Hypsizygus marmoreus TaxID=39966 RepID=A0A369J448_HYPMA|nr:hypothetical protein Hypma_003315 [Hypsizygus marmoreus]
MLSLFLTEVIANYRSPTILPARAFSSWSHASANLALKRTVGPNPSRIVLVFSAHKPIVNLTALCIESDVVERSTLLNHLLFRALWSLTAPPSLLDVLRKAPVSQAGRRRCFRFREMDS